MEVQEGLYKGVRSSDLRFDDVHILAEYVERAHRFAESATRIEAASEHLLQGAVKTTEEGVRQFGAAVRQLAVQSKNLQESLRKAAQATGSDLAHAIAGAHATGARYIMQAGEVARARYEDLASRADRVNQAAERLERATKDSEAARRRSQEAFEQLQAYKAELLRFERELLARVADAKADLYLGAGLWRRLRYVLFPPTPELRYSKAPSQPLALSQAASAPKGPTKRPPAGTGNVGASSADEHSGK